MKLYMKLIGGIAILLFCLHSTASAENHIGILLDGYQKNCTVNHKGEVKNCTSLMKLCAGDVVTKEPDIKTLLIKWAPYASGKISDTTSLVAIFEPPKNKTSIWQGMKEYFSFVRTSHNISSASARAPQKKGLPQPYNNATLMAGYKTTFAWEKATGCYMQVKDAGGREIFSKDFEEDLSLELTPDQIGMKSGKTYTCIIRKLGDSRQFKLRLLSQDVAQQVTADLEKIEQEIKDQQGRLFQKALYLQFISDAYPQDIDLYWLSYLTLDRIRNKKSLKSDDEILMNVLLDNYHGHFKDAEKEYP